MKHISTIFTLGLLFASTYGNGAMQVFAGVDPRQHVAMLEQQLGHMRQELAHQKQIQGWNDRQYRGLYQEVIALRPMGNEVVALRRENAELRARVARVDVVNFETVQKELEDLKKLDVHAELRAMRSEVVPLRRENAELRARVARIDAVKFETVQKELEDLKKLYANADNVAEVVALRIKVRTLEAQVAALQVFSNANRALTAQLAQANKEIAGLREERAKNLVAQPAMARPATSEGPDYWNKLLGL